MDPPHPARSERFHLTRLPAAEHGTNVIAHPYQSQPYRQLQPATNTMHASSDSRSMPSQSAPPSGQTMLPQNPHPQHSFPHSQQAQAAGPRSSFSYQYPSRQLLPFQHTTEVHNSTLQAQQQANYRQQTVQGHSGSMVPLNTQHRQRMTGPDTYVVTKHSLGHPLAIDHQGNPSYGKSSNNLSLPLNPTSSSSGQQIAPSAQHQGMGASHVSVHLPQDHVQGQFSTSMQWNTQNHAPNQHQQATHRTPQIRAGQTNPVESAPQHMRSISQPFPQAGTFNTNHANRLQSHKNVEQTPGLSSTQPVMDMLAVSGDTFRIAAHPSQREPSVTSQPVSGPPPAGTAAPYTADTKRLSAERLSYTILSKSFPSLGEFCRSQQKVLTSHLIHINDQYAKATQEMQGEVLRARQAEQEAIKKQEDTARAIDDFVAKAAQVQARKEELEKSCKSIHEMNVKLNRTCLQQNKMLGADASAQLLILYQDRIAYLEGRLRRYEDVPAENSSVLKDLPLKKEPGASSANPSPVETSFVEAGAQYSHNAIRTEQQTQNAAEIVSGLIDRGKKLGSPKSPISIKAEPLERDRNYSIPTIAPLFIDITGDDVDDDRGFADLLAHTMAEPLEDAPLSLGIHSGLQQEPPLLSASSSSAPQNPKRSIHDDGPPRKRPRSDFKANELTDDQRYGETTENGAPRSSETSQGSIDGDFFQGVSQEKTVIEEAKLNNLKDSIAPAEAEASLIRKEDESVAQIGPLHLQLIYQLHKSGVRACRCCQLDKKVETDFIFPATTPTEELVKHAISVHPDSVAPLLKLSQADLIRGHTMILGTT